MYLSKLPDIRSFLRSMYLNILSVAMFIFPTVFSVAIHNYLRHGEVRTQRKAVLFVVYLLTINAITYGVSNVRDVKAFRFSDMTLSYRINYMSLGVVLGFMVPFNICLLTEDVITIGGFIRFGNRTTNDLRKYMAYSLWSAQEDLRAKVASSYLNCRWWLIESFCMMIIYTIILDMCLKNRRNTFQFLCS